MRIGELAALAGISTRAVRHYHASGVLPDPVRLSNGYRDYDAADLIRLLRVARLTALGLTLAEVRAVLAQEQDLKALLADVITDIAEQQAELDARRRQLLAVIAGDLDLTSSPEVGALLAELAAVAPDLTDLGTERRLLDLLHAGSSAADFADFADAYRSTLQDTAALEAGRRIDRQLTDLADADPDDPRVAALAAELVTVGRNHFGALAGAGPDGSGSGPAPLASAWQLALDGMTPAQRRCLELAAAAFEQQDPTAATGERP